MRVIQFLLFLYFLPFIYGKVESFKEEYVWNFLKSVPRNFLSKKCGESLDRVESYLTDYNTLPNEREFYYNSFGIGVTSQHNSRDMDRWIHKAYECTKAAGETAYSASQYPLNFCYSQNTNNPSSDTYAICIPSTCNKDTKYLLNEFQKNAGKEEFKNESTDYHTCIQSRYDKQWYEQFVPVADFALDLMLVLLVGVATVYHVKKGTNGKSMSSKLLLCFSAKRNIRRLVQMPKDPQSTVTCMFGIRFLSMVWTVIGHSFIFVQVYIDNVDDFKKDLVNNFWNQWITNFTLSVDVFFTLSATLTAYSWFKKWQKNTTNNEPSWTSYGYWLRFYRHRVVRLWPAYLYTLFTVTTRISVTHYHGMWPPTDPAVQCPIHWWKNMFFVNSLFDNRCLPWTWYIGTEFIFYLLCPIFLITLRQMPKIGMFISVATMLASCIGNMIGMVYYNFPPTQFLWNQPAMFNDDYIAHHLIIYNKPWYRISPYIAGLLLGYYLALIQHNKKVLNIKYQIIGWIIGCSIGFWSLYGLYPSLQGWDWPIYHVFYGGFHRIAFSLFICWLIYACHTGIGGIINKVLSLPILLPLSSLCYSVYLFHMIPVVFTYMLVSFPIVFTTKWFVLKHCFYQLCIAYFFGMICTMVAELPALNIERVLLTRERKGTLKPIATNDKDCEMQLKPNPITLDSVKN
uniref:Acyl_transf_3 domain-containing protein n=1 Tax=Strongyloides stercoralis TaxID=6248 RepID=A0A0K0EH57_STRER